MKENEFVKKVLQGNGITPPEICRIAFEQEFKEAINVDWSNKESFFEAVFYLNNLEHIALFESSGKLVVYKQFLPTAYLPFPIKKYLEEKGEIMNAVLINKGNSIEYEIVIRNLELERFLMVLTESGKLNTEKRL